MECEGFRNFMSLVQPKWRPCTRRKLDPMIDTLFNENTLKVVETLGKIDDVATTIDLWSNDQGFYILILY